MSSSSSPFSQTKVTFLRNQQEITELFETLVSSLSAKAESVKAYSEQIVMLQTGCADISMRGDYALSDQYIMYTPGTKRDLPQFHQHGKTRIVWHRTNQRVVSAFMMFNDEVERLTNERMIGQPVGYQLSVVQREQIRVRARGNDIQRDNILKQNAVVIQMLAVKVEPSLWEKWKSTSTMFAFGVYNRDLLSVMEGIRNSVANRW